MNLFEKLNRLDDSLVESKRVVKKKKLTESLVGREAKPVNRVGRTLWDEPTLIILKYEGETYYGDSRYLVKDTHTGGEYVKNLAGLHILGYVKPEDLKEKLTESVEDDKKKLFDAAASVKCKLDDDTIEYAMYDVDDFIENELVYCGKLLLSECPDMLFWRYVSDENFGGYCAVYESDEEFADAFYQISHDRVYDITDEVNGDYDYDDDIDEMLTENRNNPYFAPYGYKDAAKVLNGKAPEYYYHLKEIEMDKGDGVKLARYAMRKGLPVMIDKNSDPDYPEFAIKGEYHWNDYFYPYPTAHEEDLVAWDGKMFVEEQLTEGNNVSSQLPPALDSFLQDIAQMYRTITYKDIMKHEYTEEDLKKLKNYRRRFRAEIPYEGDEDADAVLQNIAEKVGRLIKDDSLDEGFLNKKFLNNIDQDILNSLKDAVPELITNNSVKCSKSVVPNALYYVDKGEDVEFVLGNMQLPMKPITHCWIKHNGEVLQTRVPEADVKLIPKFTIMLTPNDIETSKKQIKHLISSI